MTTHEILITAKNTATSLALLSTEQKNEALLMMADALVADAAGILAANEQDVAAARGSVSEVMIDRLMLSEKRIDDMAQGIRDVAALPDPVGRMLDERTLSSGLKLKKVSVPMGVISIIYESRPNVTSDAAALSLKSGSVAVLRSGKEAIRTSTAIVNAMRKGLASAGVAETAINIIEDTSRDSAVEIMRARGLVDLLIPRGGAGLISACVSQAQIPCIETGTGICSIYVDGAADITKALNIIENAKTQRPSVCNAAEQLLVNEKIAPAFLPELADRLISKREANGAQAVTLIVDDRAYEILSHVVFTNVMRADESSFDTEFLDYKLAVKLVADVDEAIAHIAKHSTHHSEAIVTEDEAAAQLFTACVDSAAVYVNASTRFTDGGCFGLGCEMGISTQKIHARGPMGLEELTSYKYVITGDGQVR